MPSVLITAFEPYDCWVQNASWLTLVQLTQELPRDLVVTTRLYPVELSAVNQRLAADLKANHDYALHLGQAPGASRIQLEAIGLNVGGVAPSMGEPLRPIVEGGPVAYRSTLPLARWSQELCDRGIPAQVSYHAGTFLCNAALYVSCYFAEHLGLKTESAFIHLPLDPAQAIAQAVDMPSLSTATSASGLRLILEDLARGI